MCIGSLREAVSFFLTEQPPCYWPGVGPALARAGGPMRAPQLDGIGWLRGGGSGLGSDAPPLADRGARAGQRQGSALRATAAARQDLLTARPMSAKVDAM